MNDLLAAARSLRPLVEGEADATDRELTISAPAIEAFAESGLNHLQVPKELGGLEADVDTTLDVLEEVAHQDGSIGWVFMANANATAMCSMFDPDVARQMLEGRPDVVCAGQFVSRGKARRADGGFQVHGRFQFGSGIARATWVGGGALVRDADGNPEANDAGMPKVLAFVVPSDSVEITGNWDVMGLRGTGSFDYSITEQLVEEGRTFWLFDGEPRSGGGVYRLGVVGFAGIGHSGWALGVARRALDEIHDILASGSGPHRWRADEGRPGRPAGVQPAHARAALGPPARARHDREHRGTPRSRRPHDQGDAGRARERGDLPDRRLHGRRALGLHDLGQLRAPEPERPAALLPRHVRRCAAHLRRSPMPRRDGQGASRNGVNMTEPHIERFGPDVSIGSLIEALDRDGVAMVSDAIPPELLSALNAEFDGLIAGSEPGTPNHIPMLIDFMGHKTHRIDGLPGKSKSFVELLQHPLALEMADHYLLPSCLHYLLSTAQLIEILADETVQHLHRDDTAWIYPPMPTDRDAVPTVDVPQLEVIVLYALCDFTAENGATRVVPGSHLWPARRKPQEHEVVAAEMKAGSAIYYVGKTLHGGGPNLTQDQPRRALFLGFSLGWLRTKENFFISTPIEAVREMPPRVQQLLGYETHGGIGVVDVGCPSALLRT